MICVRSFGNRFHNRLPLNLKQTKQALAVADEPERRRLSSDNAHNSTVSIIVRVP